MCSACFNDLLLIPPQINFNAVGEAYGMSPDVAKEHLERLLEDLHRIALMRAHEQSTWDTSSRRAGDITPSLLLSEIQGESLEYTEPFPDLEQNETARRTPGPEQRRRRHLTYLTEEDEDEEGAPLRKKRRTAEPPVSGRVSEADPRASGISNEGIEHNVESLYGGLESLNMRPLSDFPNVENHQTLTLHAPGPASAYIVGESQGLIPEMSPRLRTAFLDAAENSPHGEMPAEQYELRSLEDYSPESSTYSASPIEEHYELCRFGIDFVETQSLVAKIERRIITKISEYKPTQPMAR